MSISKRKVLVIDDSVTARISIKSILTKNSCETYTAENGLDALLQAKKLQPNLILLDLSMPVWDGFMVLSILKNSSETSGIPIAILSGKEDLSDKVRAKMLGAFDFIIKPCSEDALLQLLGKL